MKRANTALLSLLIVFSFILAACNNDLEREMFLEGPPAYSDWKHCFGDTVRTCFDDNHYFANQMVIEYWDESLNAKELLIWSVFKRSNYIFRMHRGGVKSFQVEKMFYNFYVMESGGWKLVMQRSLVRGKSIKNEDIFLFPKDSVFGRRFIQNMKNKGFKEEEIEIPKVQFMK